MPKLELPYKLDLSIHVMISSHRTGVKPVLPAPQRDFIVLEVMTVATWVEIHKLETFTG